MAQLFLDNPSLYTTGTINNWWFGGSNGFSVTNTQVAPGSQAGSFSLDNSSGGGGNFVQSNNFGNKTRLILGFRYYRARSDKYAVAGFSVANQPGIGQTDTCVFIAANNLGTYIVKGDGTILGSGPIIPLNEWHHYEFDATFSTTGAATLKLYIDGSPTAFISVTASNTLYSYANFFQLGNTAPGGHGYDSQGGYYQDAYCFDSTGGAPLNAALAPQGYGAPKTAFAIPNGAGMTTQWTPNGAASNWQCVNSIPPAGDVKYNAAATVGFIDFYTLSSFPAMATLLSAQASVFAREDDAGPRSIQTGFSNGTTSGFSGADQYLGGSYQYFFQEFPTNPVTGLAWTPTDLATLQAGIKLTH